MITVRQMERLWHLKAYGRMSRLFLEMRPEVSTRLTIELSRPLTAAALVVIWLDELNQSYLPFCGQMVRTILAGQEMDGGWADPFTTAVCVRALLCSGGEGLAIDRGIDYLAALQQDEGLWPRDPLRRMPPDPFVSAFVLRQLAEMEVFRSAVRLDDAVAWFEQHQAELDPDTARLWRSISLKCSLAHRAAVPADVWS